MNFEEKSAFEGTPLRTQQPEQILLASAGPAKPEQFLREISADRIFVQTYEGPEGVIRSAERSGVRCIILVHGRELEAVSLCRAIRIAGVLVPIVVLVDPCDASTTLAFIDVGADLVFHPEEQHRIRTHVQVLMRTERDAFSGPLRCGPIRVDRERGKATVAGTQLDLSRNEVALLWLMCRYPGRPMTLEELGRELLGRAPSRSDRRALVQRIARLRQKLGHWARLIEADRGSYLVHSGDTVPARSTVGFARGENSVEDAADIA